MAAYKLRSYFFKNAQDNLEKVVLDKKILDNEDIQNENANTNRQFGNELKNNDIKSQNKKLDLFKNTFQSDNIRKELIKISNSDSNNPQSVTNYSIQIFEYLRAIENQYKISEYMKKQKELNSEGRYILVEWLIDVHRQYKMAQNTLFLTIYIIDKYLESNQISLDDFQLIGIVSMFIASKYEDIYPPRLQQFIQLIDNVDNDTLKEKFLEMESQILISLDFNVSITTSLKFLERYIRFFSNNKQIYQLGRYLIELTLINYHFVKYLPSKIACTALYLACKILQIKDYWSKMIEYHSQYNEKSLQQCAKEMCLIFNQAQSDQTTAQAIKKKFSQVQQMQPSKLQFQ